MECKTRCRLCLKPSLDLIDIIPLFDKKGNIIATNLIQLISNYLNLNITAKDLISNCVCQDCSDNLNDFEKYCQFVYEQQKTLKNEFLEIVCKSSAEDLPSLTTTGTEDTVEDPLDSIETPLKRGHVETVVEEFMENISKHKIEYNTLDSFSSGDEKPLITIRKKEKKTLKSRKKTRKPTVTDNDDDDTNKIIDNERAKKLESEIRNRELIASFMQLKCDLCAAKVDCYADLRKHFNREHQQTAYVKCCGRILRRATDLAAHIDLHQNPEKYTCKFCHRKFKKLTSLDVHLLKHGNKSDKVCEKCHRAFSNNKCLKNHQMKNSCCFQCTQCKKSFTNKTNLCIHVSAVHDNFFPHVCEKCGRKFKKKDTFENHKLTFHQGIKEKPVQCKECKNWLKNETSLRIHMYRHIREEALCPHCDRILPSVNHLRRHIYYSHRTPKHLACTYCDKKFRFLRSLQEHIAVHTGVKLYTCIHCGKDFRSKAYMYYHMKHSHYQKWLKAKMDRSHKPDTKISA